jgi:hypothetical protein
MHNILGFHKLFPMNVENGYSMQSRKYHSFWKVKFKNKIKLKNIISSLTSG